MRYFVLLLFSLFGFGSFSQNNREEVEDIIKVHMKLKGENEFHVMMWDDFTFSFNQNEAEVTVVEGGSYKKEIYRAKKIEFVHIITTRDTIELTSQKNAQGKKCVLVEKVIEKQNFAVFGTPNVVQPVFYYLFFENEMVGFLPQKNNDFVGFFNCPELTSKYQSSENQDLKLEAIIERFESFVEQCVK